MQILIEFNLGTERVREKKMLICSKQFRLFALISTIVTENDLTTFKI